MAFSESVKLEAKKRSHYVCVWCQRTDQFLEVHHITPQEEGGSDTIDNAAPLCPGCHTLLGNNTEIRRQLGERRDWWWGHCAEARAPMPNEDMSRQLDELVESLRKVEAQGGRSEAILTELKGHVVGRLQAQATAVGSASTSTGVIQAYTSDRPPHVYQLMATITFSGSGHRHGMPDPYHSYFVVASTAATMTHSGQVSSGASASITPVLGDAAGPEQYLFVPNGSPAEALELARTTLRSLPQNHGLREDYYPRGARAV
jgi:hypothetical protein